MYLQAYTSIDIKDLSSLCDNEQFISFIKLFENRNTMNRVISKHSVGLDFVCIENDLSQFYQLIHHKGKDLSVGLPNEIPADLDSEINRYNKRDIDLYDHCVQLKLQQ